MKKFIASLAIAGVAAGLSAQDTGSSISDLSITGTFDFETEYVFRAKELQQQSFQPSVEFGFPVLGGDLYTGVWTAQPIKAGEANEIDFYAGYAYPVTDMFTLDVGFTYYWYPDSAGANTNTTYLYAPNPTVGSGYASQTREIYFGVSADVILSPAVYFYYDFDLEQVVVEGSIGYSFDLGEYVGTEGISFDIGGYLGYLSANSYGAGSQRNQLNKWNNGYVYGGITGDLVYAFSENVSSSIGVRWAANNDGEQTSFNAPPGVTTSLGPDQNLWFGATVGFAY